MEHPLYIRQRNIYTRGGKAKPVCVIKDKVITGAVTKVLEYYSLEENDTHTVDQFIYIPELAAENVQTNFYKTHWRGYVRYMYLKLADVQMPLNLQWSNIILQLKTYCNGI